MFKNWEITLYFLTAFFCVFVDDLLILLAIVLADVLMLLIVRLMCRRLLKSFDMERYVNAKKLLNASEVCFVMAAIFAGFSLIRMAFYMIFLPESFFSGSLWLGYLVQILPALGLWIFFHRTSGALNQVQRKKSFIDSPPSEKLEDFYAFSNVPGVERSEDEDEDREESREKELSSGEIPDLSALIADTIPDEDEFRQHLQMISLMSHVSEPAALWECPACGSLNPAESEQCGFCGVDRENVSSADINSYENKCS